MSRENVELVHRVVGSARNDPAVLFEIFHDEVVWEVGEHDIADGPAFYRGPAGVQEFFRRWAGSFDDWGYELGEVIDAGESVVVESRQWGRGKTSGAPVSDQFWQVWTFRDGKVIHRTRHQDRAAALEAAGPA